MFELSAIFNNRELALLIWLLGVFLYLFWKRETRESLKEVTKAFFKKPILTIFFLFVPYVIAICIILNRIGLWNSGNLKTTIFWFVGTGIFTLFGAQKAKEENYFQEALKEQLSLIILLEFIVNIYVFSFLAELIILPVVTFIFLAIVVAEGRDQYKPAYNFLNWILTFFGFYLLFNGVYQTFNNYREIINQTQFIELVIVPILSISILPFIYVFALFLIYETLFSKINFWTKDKNLARLAKHKLVRVFNINLKQLTAFSKKHGMIDIKSREDLNKITIP